MEVVRATRPSQTLVNRVVGTAQLSGRAAFWKTHIFSVVLVAAVGGNRRCSNPGRR